MKLNEIGVKKYNATKQAKMIGVKKKKGKFRDLFRQF